MREISISQMKRELHRIEKLVEREGSLVLTRRGRPVARVLPLGGTPPSHAELRASMPRMSRSSAELIREDRAGRD